MTEEIEKIQEKTGETPEKRMPALSATPELRWYSRPFKRLGSSTVDYTKPELEQCYIDYETGDTFWKAVHLFIDTITVMVSNPQPPAQDSGDA
jgi:hypothetical protein